MKLNKFTTPVKIEIPGIGTIESADLYLKSEVDAAIEEPNDLLKATEQDRDDWEILCEETQKDVPGEI